MNWLLASTAHLLIGVVVCAVLALLLVVFLIWWLRRHRVEEAAPEAETAPASLMAAEPEPAALTAAELPGEVKLSFLHAVRYLRSQTTGRNRLYQAPWFLLLGESGCGKSTLLQTLGATGAGAVEGANPRRGLGWRFFDHGVVLDVPGEYVVRPDTLTAHERSWRGLLRHLNRYRPRRPVDGVVLVLPAHDFATPAAMDNSDLVRKATRISDKLAQLQRESGVCFPVYVLVSKCDQIPGFDSFCQALPAGRRREMFGWSSPYRAEAAFESAWVDEAFDQVVESLNRSQSELFAERLEAVDPAGLYFFPSEMLQMRDRLRSFLHQIFRTTAYRESYHCRGLYFCGDAPPERAAADAEEESEPARGGGMLGLQLPPAAAAPHPAFIDDLFERKIFPEWGLAYPERHAFAFRRGAMLTAQTATLATAAVLAGGLGWGTYRLNQLTQQALPVLQRIESEMHDAQAASTGQGEPVHNDNELVQNVNNLGDNRLFSAFIPASWPHTLDNHIESAIQVAFEKSVLQIALKELEAKAEGVGTDLPAGGGGTGAGSGQNGGGRGGGATGGGLGPGNGIFDPAAAPMTLQQLPAYQALAQFTGEVSELEDNIRRYQNVSVPGSRDDVRDLNALIRYLHPNGGYTATAGADSYFARALDAAAGSPFPPAVLTATRDRVRAEMISRLDALYDAWFQNNPGLATLDRLSDEIDALQSAPNFSFVDLQQLQNSLEQAEALVRSPQSVWIGDENAIFAGPLRQATLQPVLRSAELPEGLFRPTAELESYIRQNSSSDWQALHDDLAAEQTTLTGPLLQFGGTTAELSPGVENLRLPIADLMGLSFMAGNPSGRMLTTIPAGSQLSWDPLPLQEAVDMVAAYHRYLNEGLLEAPSAVREALRRVALAHLTANVVQQISDAEVWSPAPAGSSEIADVNSEIQSFQAAQPLLSELMQDLAQLGQNTPRAQLMSLAHAHALNLLRGLQRELQQEAPYSTHNTLAGWAGTRPPAQAAFDLGAPADLAGYLAFERGQVQALATAATPVVQFLQRAQMPSGSVADAQLQSEWEALTTVMKQYANKVPGNSLRLLEDYISTGMAKTTPASHCQLASVPATTSAPADYFLAARARLRSELERRCLQLAAGDNHRNYDTLAALFNQTLADKFPFAAPAPGVVEADPGKIADFYQRLAKLQPTLGGDQEPPAVAAFVTQLEATQPIWSGYLTNLAKAPLPVFDVTPTFRANRGRERHGNQIIGWSLQVGNQTVTATEAAKSLRWTLGTPVTLTLQWAKDSPEIPVGQPQSGEPRVEGLTVTYTYTDPWALFSLVEGQLAPAGAFPALTDAQPATLAFTVPLAAAGAANPAAATDHATVFIRLAIASPGKVESLRFSEFPRRAPVWK